MCRLLPRHSLKATGLLLRWTTADPVLAAVYWHPTTAATYIFVVDRSRLLLLLLRYSLQLLLPLQSSRL